MLEDDVEALLRRPRAEQLAGLQPLLDGLGPAQLSEEWNTTFGPRSLFDAWTSTSIATGLYVANGQVLRKHLDGRSDWRIIEVGGGDGKLWNQVLRPGDQGEIIVVDPVPEAHSRVQLNVPDGVSVRGITGFVQDVELPDADAVVCSLTLHHVAGADAAERAAHGLSGPGKLETLIAFGQALKARSGIGILNEANMMCDLSTPPGDQVTRENVFDSYVRRCAPGVISDIRGRSDADEDLRARWRAMLRHWFLEQVRVADLPLADRDVYELPVGRWMALMGRADLLVRSNRCTDDYELFWQYVFEPKNQGGASSVSP